MKTAKTRTVWANGYRVNQPIEAGTRKLPCKDGESFSGMVYANHSNRKDGWEHMVRSFCNVGTDLSTVEEVVHWGSREIDGVLCEVFRVPGPHRGYWIALAHHMTDSV